MLPVEVREMLVSELPFPQRSIPDPASLGFSDQEILRGLRGSVIHERYLMEELPYFKRQILNA